MTEEDKKMVLAVRIKKYEENCLKLVSKKQHMNKSEVVKDLLHRGFLLYELDEYKAGNISLGKLAEDLKISSLEALNLVASYNIYPHLPKDYLAEAKETAKVLFK